MVILFVTHLVSVRSNAIVSLVTAVSVCVGGGWGVCVCGWPQSPMSDPVIECVVDGKDDMFHHRC